MELIQKLDVLSDAAKYDVACTSSGVDREEVGKFGNCVAKGICHSFSSDGRCISLLKILLTNVCSFNCAYCINRTDNDVPRASFTPREVATLTMEFYKRNYIEGLFLSSAIPKSPDHTMEQLIETLRILRYEYGFYGYIHAKTIPGASPQAIRELGYLADRISVNIEMPSEQSLNAWAPQKSRAGILRPMGYISQQLKEQSLLSGEQKALMTRRNESLNRSWQKTPKFAPAGHSTQMIVGASPESDCTIMTLTQGLYRNYGLKRVFYSAYLPVNHNPKEGEAPKPPLLREHRLYQADWLLRFYGFEAEELFTEREQNLDLQVDPKCGWALRHPELFPVEVNRADKETLLRVPGIGVIGANRILTARRYGSLTFEGLKRMGIVLKRAKHFILCNGKAMEGMAERPEWIRMCLTDHPNLANQPEQLSLFQKPTGGDVYKCLSGQM
ncbi:MAG: putative DNA modification/repair radical SAM protein [Ruminococcaceae bacterium]|nr:putative DNA modification/repair radical SAM protein [Oscillospiraceae bacterium]